MTIRTTKKTMVFHEPFLMQYFDQELPAGTYEVVTEEEQLEGISFLAYRRLQTYIYRRSPPPKSGLAPTYAVDPYDLEAAFIRDGNGHHAREAVDCSTRESLDALPAEFDRASDDGMFIGSTL
jgi:hypothetical protein